MVENPLKNPLYMGPNKLRWKDLTDDDVYTTPYAVAIAAPPSDDTLRIMWIVESTCLLLISISIALVFSSIILSKKARSTPFNLYLLFLSFPDWVYSFLCFLTCLLCAIKGDYFSEMMCHAQSVYLIFGTAANCWLNAIIAYEVHRLLQASKVTRRYTPPSNKSVYQRSVFAYALSLALAFSTLFGTVVWESYPMTIGANYGFVCIPTQDTTKDMLYFFLFFIPLYVGIPFGYVFWVCYDVLFRSKLLPEHGQRRDIAVYFFRISFVFLLFWTPSILVIYIFRSSHWWLRYWIGLMSHFQGMASAGVSLIKSDVMEAFQNLISCRWQEANLIYVEERRLMRTGMSRSEAKKQASSSINFVPTSSDEGAGGSSSFWWRTDRSRMATSSSNGVVEGKSQIESKSERITAISIVNDVDPSTSDDNYPYDIPRQKDNFQFEDEDNSQTNNNEQESPDHDGGARRIDATGNIQDL